MRRAIFLGVGFAGYSVAIPRYLKSSGEWTPQQAHNEYLEVLASGGAVGALLCGWFALVLLGELTE
jgi:O-antigen ligase